MEPLDRFDQYAASARNDAPPLVDVTDAVMREIRTVSSAQHHQTRVLYAMATLAAAAAIVVAVVSFNVYERMTDPLVSVLVASTRIMP